jgi:NADH dehydrogenase
MPDRQTHTVTGAYGFSGKYLARRLLERGHRVGTLTNSLERENPFGAEVEAHPFDFDRPERLTETLAHTRVLYNTYWVRFDHRDFNHEAAVRNTKTLFDCARKAGVERVVHVSITNPAIDSPLPYFRGKAELERALRESGLSHAILRPAVLFGPEDILINNIAWMLRRFPIFGVFGDGGYGIQPIHVDDLAALAVQHGEGTEPVTIDAIGPESFTYRGLVEQIGEIIGKRRPIISLSPGTGYLLASSLGLLLRDVVITREEIAGLMAGLLAVEASPTGTTPLTDWAREHRDALGRKYANELGRRRDRTRAYR